MKHILVLVLGFFFWAPHTVQATESIFIENGFVADDGANFTAFISDASAVTAGSFTFKYDYIGNIIENNQDGSTIDWTVYGKVDKVTYLFEMLA